MVHFFRLNSSYSSIVAVRTESIIEKFDSNQNTTHHTENNPTTLLSKCDESSESSLVFYHSESIGQCRSVLKPSTQCYSSNT